MGSKVAICLLASCSMLSGVERCNIVAQADMVVRGRLVDHRLDYFPGGGFELAGEISISRVLCCDSFSVKRLPYLFRCPGCSRPDVSILLREDGVWGLKRGQNRWFPAGGATGDPGWRPLSALEGLEECFELERNRRGEEGWGKPATRER